MEKQRIIHRFICNKKRLDLLGLLIFLKTKTVGTAVSQYLLFVFPDIDFSVLIMLFAEDSAF